MKNLLIKIASIATELDYAGLTKEAKQMDSILLKLAMPAREKPEFDYLRGLKDDKEIRYMDKRDRVKLFLEVQQHINRLKNYLFKHKSEYGDDGSYIKQQRNLIKTYENRIERDPLDTYAREQAAKIKNEIGYFQQEIKKIENEIDMFTDYAKKLNFDGAYDPDYEYDNGHRLKKRNIFHQMLGRDPKRDPNF